eukprot:scaffold578761_cov32-Prasinocladus_malaysianus.AAC.1
MCSSPVLRVSQLPVQHVREPITPAGSVLMNKSNATIATSRCAPVASTEASLQVDSAVSKINRCRTFCQQ